MAVLMKSLSDLKTAIDEDRVVAIWGTATQAFAIVQDRDAEPHVVEMWRVTP